MASHHFTTAVTEGDGSVRVLGHHGSKQPTSNSESTLRNEAGCFRNSHVAFGVLGDGALSAVGARDVEVRYHSPGLRHANVTAITGAHLTPNISPRMNGGVNQKTPRWNSRDQLRAKERNLRQVLTNDSWVARRYFGKRIEMRGREIIRRQAPVVLFGRGDNPRSAGLFPK